MGRANGQRKIAGVLGSCAAWRRSRYGCKTEPPGKACLPSAGWPKRACITKPKTANKQARCARKVIISSSVEPRWIFCSPTISQLGSYKYSLKHHIYGLFYKVETSCELRTVANGQYKERQQLRGQKTPALGADVDSRKMGLKRIVVRDISGRGVEASGRKDLSGVNP